MTEQTKPKCFVISPIGERGGPIRIRSDFFRYEIVAAALTDFKVERADDFTDINQITHQIIQAINSADLIVADMTDANPNVFYELGVAHSYKKHVIPMIVDTQTPPFDNQQIRYLAYSMATVQSKEEARATLKNAVATTMASEPSNPVTLALGKQQQAASGDSQAVLMTRMEERMNNMESKVNAMTRVRNQGLGAFRPTGPALTNAGLGAAAGWISPAETPMPIFNETQAVALARTFIEGTWIKSVRERLGSTWDSAPEALKETILNELRTRNIVQPVTESMAGDIAYFRMTEFLNPKRTNE